jgi:hypothetical protein
VDIAEPQVDKDLLNAEVERLRTEYDIRTLEDWCREMPGDNTLPFLTQKAWALISDQLYKKARHREASPTIVTAFHKWVEGRDLQFDSGPVYWRLFARDAKKPFAFVRKSDGAILPPRGSSGQPNTKARSIKSILQLEGGYNGFTLVFYQDGRCGIVSAFGADQSQ